MFIADPIIKKSYSLCGLKVEDKSGYFSLENDEVLSFLAPEGVTMRTQKKNGWTDILVCVKKGRALEKPLFFCFGVKDKKGIQLVRPKIILEENSSATIVAHCGFPMAENVEHQMEGAFILRENARLNYQEYHYHGQKAGAKVFPRLKVEVGEGGFFLSDFSLIQGTIGKVKIELETHLKKNSRVEILTKAMGKDRRDEVEIIDRVFLEGENSRGLIKMRAAAKNGGKVFMQGETYALKSGCRGHIDCQEILFGQKSIARAVPIVEVAHPEARVTHEASVGKINQKELEVLMTRGLSADKAADLIVDSIMKNS